MVICLLNGRKLHRLGKVLDASFKESESGFRTHKICCSHIKSRPKYAKLINLAPLTATLHLQSHIFKQYLVEL